MKLVLLVVGLCAAAALAADVKEEATKTVDKAAKAIDGAAKEGLVQDKLKKEDAAEEEPVDKLDEIVKLPGMQQSWAQSVLSAAPTAFVFSANLPMYTKTKVKPEIATAFNLQQELDHWQQTGNPEHLTFLGDDGKPEYAVMTSAPQPVLFSSYAKDIKFHLFTKANKSDYEGYLLNRDRLDEAPFVPGLPLKVVVHGFTNTIKSPVIQLLKNAFLESGTKYNVIGMDWGTLCPAPWYQTARAHVTGAGAELADLLDSLVTLKKVEPKKIHIIGHSLGAHVAGITGKHMLKGKPARISGLDPAGPLFELTNKNGILWRDDADLVDVIHTNAGFLGLGKSKHLGHVDFYPNGGRLQPGCHHDWTGSCSHGRSYELYEFSIRNPEAPLGAFLCKTLPKDADKCEKSGNKKEVAQMGYDVQYGSWGTYYLKTSDKPDWRIAA